MHSCLAAGHPRSHCLSALAKGGQRARCQIAEAAHALRQCDLDCKYEGEVPLWTIYLDLGLFTQLYMSYTRFLQAGPDLTCFSLDGYTNSLFHNDDTIHLHHFSASSALRKAVLTRPGPPRLALANQGTSTSPPSSCVHVLAGLEELTTR